ncbi:hypothetical protein EWM64_g1283 [Hericium alpestre]|uniref:DNA2/NAM7 helicase-like C-terminal domain-containing protein n=1 Tax=Hericium alpestre TaxID=135208 RepID=A0A4Z0AAZ7_9AGAM|nr:hypothetical protein EWM64_g1283 [Hericium alpestre]
MPECFGEFISENVYDGKLLSVHPIMDTGCVRFVDVTKGQEQADGSSWKNMEEVHTIVRLIRFYYQHTDFCVITPYDAQRAAIVRTLEAENLPSNRVFNVDSFQGNEADFVILTPVRTNSAGFLNSKQRMNVALTRFKKGMVIVTNECFVSGAGQNTLLGRLAAHWEQEDGDVWTDWIDIVNQTADMPGVRAPRVRPALTPAPALPSQSDFRNGADRTVSPLGQRAMRSRAFGSDSADPISISARTTPEPTRNPVPAALSDLQVRIDQRASLLPRRHNSAVVCMTSHDAFPALPSSTTKPTPTRAQTTAKPVKVQGCWGDTRKLASVKDSSTAPAQRDEVDDLASAFSAMMKNGRAKKQRR